MFLSRNVNCRLLVSVLGEKPSPTNKPGSVIHHGVTSKILMFILALMAILHTFRILF